MERAPRDLSWSKKNQPVDRQRWSYGFFGGFFLSASALTDSCNSRIDFAIAASAASVACVVIRVSSGLLRVVYMLARGCACVEHRECFMHSPRFIQRPDFFENAAALRECGPRAGDIALRLPDRGIADKRLRKLVLRAAQSQRGHRRAEMLPRGARIIGEQAVAE